MNDFEFYMIGMIKVYADKIRRESDEDIKLMMNNVVMELISSFVNFEAFHNGIFPGDVMEDDFVINDKDLHQLA